MPVELTELAAGLPFAASFAMSLGISALREGRRRSSLNEAIHELRRPLQVLALSLPADVRGGEAAGSALGMTASAIDRLDREINGGTSEAVANRVRVRPEIDAAIARWRPRAVAEGRSLELVWSAPEPAFRGDGVELAQAVDNLISNAFEHGTGAVEIHGHEEGGLLRVVVHDGGASGGSVQRRSRLGRDRHPRRHGHGLRIVRRLAARSGGSFRLKTTPGGTEARLDLPLVQGSW